jgi:flagellar biosynthesis protein FlhG
VRSSGALVVACGGGKGGAGKSLVAANLGIAIARLGMRTVLVDADLGAANLHTMFGIDQPGATLGALIDRRVANLEEVSIPTGEPRLFLVPGTGAVVGSANLAHAQKLKLLGHIRRIDAEVIIVDVGAGVAFNTLDLFDVGDVRLVVATPQLTSLQNAYAFTKGAVYRGLRAAAHDDAERELLSGSSDHTETERVGHSIARVEQRDPQLAGRMRRIVAGFGGAIVGNQLEGPSQRNVLFGLSRMARDFLGVELPVVAELPLDPQLHRSVTDRKPYLLTHPGTRLAQAFGKLAEQVAMTNLSAVREARALTEPEAPPASADAEFGETLTPYLRREPRVAVDWPGMVRGGAGESYGRVVDVSLRGALVATPLQLDRGVRVELRMQRYPDSFLGVVRHARPGYLGVEFDVAHEAPVRDATARLGRDRRDTPGRLSVVR